MKRPRRSIHALALALCTVAPLAAGWAGPAPAGQDPEYQIDDLRPGVHLIRGHGANTVVLHDDTGIVLIDSKLEQHATALRRAVERLGPGTVRHLINTHHHLENCGGNRAFPEAAVLAHENAARRLRAAGRPGATIGFRTQVTLNLPHETIELRDAGPAHTDGDTIVHLTESRVLMLGGLVADRIHPAILPEHGADPRSWLASLRSIRARFADRDLLFVPGDGRAGGIELIDRQIAYLQDLVDLMESAHRHGLSLREALDTAQPLREKYAGYRGDHFERSLEATYRITGS